jgi:hypothetical protein
MMASEPAGGPTFAAGVWRGPIVGPQFRGRLHRVDIGSPVRNCPGYLIRGSGLERLSLIQVEVALQFPEPDVRSIVEFAVLSPSFSA